MSVTTVDHGMRSALFDQLQQGFNFGNYQDRRDVFVDCVLQLIADHPGAPGAATVLDIGCGRGIRQDREPQRRIAAAAGRLWGVEPDPGVAIDPGLFERSWRSTLEQAEIPSGSVDLAYAHMVVEHVADPEAFTRTLHRILKPGGAALLLTINARSYLGRCTRTSHRLGIQDAVLRLLRSKGTVESYHYPALYRLNDEDEVRRIADLAGFERVECAYLDRGEAAVYFPPALGWVPRLLERRQRRSRRPDRLTNLLLLLAKG